MGLRAQIGRTAAIAAALTLPACAAERVTLSNGFAQLCDHHEIVDGKYRLYVGKESESYIEFPQSEIVSIEWAPDPPPEPAPAPDKTAELAPPNSPVKSPAAEPKLTAADLRQMLASAGSAHNVDEDLLASVVKAESNGNVRAVSRAGAQGLMQLMPATAADLGVHDTFKAEDNIRGGSAYLDWLLKRYNDNLALALAAYNAGPAAVDKYHGMPPYRETRLYVARVIHEFNRRVKERQRLAALAKTQASIARQATEHKSAE